ncbi:beta strand repeat-containing protein [Bythopirellula polymerisocia]|uniref:Autotransporter-associated beta strand repeat protein n=1 Tax=Bythopirellula polymerisocia TaxID=2528003 RepID=A0A5C6CT97_9BACT|nr:autotransporter-associated beta strand repeat-containing protein [Bythopirellula polymerisocia]TWU27752.1 Autotransporter-associated beta strand repeat protein [Bythopirellula polymerisocia]
MFRFKVVSLFAVSMLLSAWISPAEAQLTEFLWNGSTGAQNWQQNGNWDMANFPNDPQHVANLSVGLGSNLTIDIGTTGNDVTIAGLNIGGTAGSVTTDLVSSGATLRFHNGFSPDLADADFNNNKTVDGADFLIWQRNYGTNVLNKFFGDANGDFFVDGADLQIWKDNYGLDSLGLNSGAPIITTKGAVGTINRISSNVHIVGEQLQVGGGANLTIAGNISFQNDTPEDGGILSSISNTNSGITTTINGDINLVNQFDGMGGAFGLNTHEYAQGTLIVNGVIDDGAVSTRLWVGPGVSAVVMPLNTVRLNSANTHSGGVTLRRVNLELADDAALGTGSLAQQGPNNQYGFNIIPVNGDRTLANDIVVQHNTTFKGSQNLTLTGAITQQNNKSFVNLLDAGKTLTLTGRLDIWNDDEQSDRVFVFDGTGSTMVTGLIRDDPLDSGQFRAIEKSGTGVLKIDVAAGGNQHTSRTLIKMGNMHYADNGSLNTGAGLILSLGGAVGVDSHPVGQNLGTNATFLGKIDPTSTGGLMLASTDTSTALNFTAGDLAVFASKMSVAAPETGISYTGTITPAGNTYKLGGGVGTLTLPNAQLSGGNSLIVKNGGTVQLLGDNTFTGSTTILTKYSSTRQEQAAADTDSTNVAKAVFYDRFVSPTLVVDHLANGNSPSSIGSASNVASNLLIQGSTLKYVGNGDTTDRLFTIGTGGATINASGTGAVVFSNTGALGRADAASRTGSLISTFPTSILGVVEVTDIVAGMPVSDPSPGGIVIDPQCNPDGSNCIPAGTVVTGVSDDGKQITLSNGIATTFKPNTTIVFGTTPRTLTLDGLNSGNNTIASVISNSAAGGIVGITKKGTGKWLLTGANTYTGDTSVEAGILSMNNAFLADSSAVRISTGGILDLNFGGSDIVGSLFLNGAAQANGLWGSLASSATFKSPLFTGNGLLNVGGTPLGALAAVPEPNALILAAMATLGLAGFRRRSPLALC